MGALLDKVLILRTQVGSIPYLSLLSLPPPRGEVFLMYLYNVKVVAAFTVAKRKIVRTLIYFFLEKGASVDAWVLSFFMYL